MEPTVDSDSCCCNVGYSTASWLQHGHSQRTSKREPTTNATRKLALNNANIRFQCQIIIDFCNGSVLHTYGTAIEETPLNLLWSFVVSIFLIGGCVGALMGGPIANEFGR